MEKGGIFQMIITDLKILRQKSKTTTEKECKDMKIFEKLEKELQGTTGVGLSAIQIGIPVKAAIIRLPKLDINLYNPEILALSEPFTFIGEGCLSIPGKVGATKRYNQIVILNGDKKVVKAIGVEAVVLQHEIDHINGILFIDRLADKSKGRD